MEEILPVNIAEGGGRKGLHAAGVCDTHAASSCFEDFTGKIFSIHSSRATTMQGVCARRAHAVFAEDGRVPAQETALRSLFSPDTTPGCSLHAHGADGGFGVPGDGPPAGVLGLR